MIPLYINAINITLIYVIILFIIVRWLANKYSIWVTNKTLELNNINTKLLTFIKSNAMSGSLELFQAQQKLFKNLGFLLCIATGKIIIYLGGLSIIFLLPFNIGTPFDIPLIFNINDYSFVSESNPQTFVFCLILYMIIITLSLNMLKYIKYYIYHKRGTENDKTNTA